MARTSSTMERPGRLVWTVTAVAALLLLLPVFVIVPLSFTGERSFAFLPSEWSLDPWRNLFSDRAWWASIVNSLNIALLTMVVTTVLGVLAALGLRSVGPNVQGLLRALLMAPLIVPTIVTGVAVYSIYLEVGLTGTLAGFVVAHTVLAIPFVLIVVSAQLGNLDRTYEQAGASLGAKPITAFFTIVLPQIIPSVATGALFAFVTSFDESVVALFLRSPAVATLPTTMYTAVAEQLDVTIAAAAALVIIASTVLVLVMLAWTSRRAAKEKK